jgi:Major Facilitator Superfamily
VVCQCLLPEKVGAPPRRAHTWSDTDGFHSTAFQPLYGQLANVFGRRWPTIAAVALFALGSGVSGGATLTAMLIGRRVQGIGLGGVNMMIDIIVCDLVPLRKRGNFMGLIFAVFAVGSSIGPFVGGVLTQRVTWRWVFYICLPISGTALLLMVLFLHVEYRKETTFKEKMRHIDWLGNAILISSVVSILLALTYGGTIHPWSSWRSIVPLVLGFVGFIIFHIYEATSFCVEPTMPPRLFANRTSSMAFILTFLHGMLTYWVIYFLPVYFQAVLRSDPTRSGVQLLPTVIVLVPFAIITGAIITATGRYKPLQIAGFALMALGIGLFAMLDVSSNTGTWVGFQILVAAGSGLIVTSSLPAVQAELPEGDVAASTATWAFLRSFGSVWGVSIPAAIFNNRFDSLAGQINDKAARTRLSGGAAYEHASNDFIGSFPAEMQGQIVNTYSGALELVWQVAIAFAALGFILSWFEKEVELRKTLETDYGLKDDKAKKGRATSEGAAASTSKST